MTTRFQTKTITFHTQNPNGNFDLLPASFFIETKKQQVSEMKLLCVFGVLFMAAAVAMGMPAEDTQPGETWFAT